MSESRKMWEQLQYIHIQIWALMSQKHQSLRWHQRNLCLLTCSHLAGLYAIQEVAAPQEVNQFTSLGSYCGAACTCFMTGKTVWLLSNLKPYHVPVYDAGSQVGLHMGLQCVTLSWSCWVSITLVYTVTDQCFLREWASNNMLNSRGEKIPRLWDGSDMRVCVRVLTVLGAFPVYEYIYII